MASRYDTPVLPSQAVKKTHLPASEIQHKKLNIFTRIWNKIWYR